MNHYARAIDLITSNDINLKAIAIDYAKRHPKAFVDAATRYDQAHADLASLALSNKVGAIKEYRARTGASLKDAKDVIEAMIERERRIRRQETGHAG